MSDADATEAIPTVEIPAVGVPTVIIVPAQLIPEEISDEPTIVLPSHRPSSMDPKDLGFTPQSPVPWLGPVLLAATGARVALASQFGAYLDKRELQGAFATRIFEEHALDEELWVDYVADLGDGFNATYSIAWLLAQKKLTVDGHELPRADVLLMGGDQVYPTASSEAYENRMVGPYLAAMPTPAPGETPPTLFALPGNHDWYDGLTAFLRLFARREGGHLGAWQTKQTRSYFAMKLPNKWWILAVDVQAEAYLDDPQMDYFRSVAALMGPDDKVIITYPQPSWAQTREHPRGYDTLAYFRRKLIDPTGAKVAVMISGDTHHYARYAEKGSDAEHLITAGGGGAYLAATHGLPTSVTVPPRQPFARDTRQRDYTLRKTYPSRARSHALGGGIFARLPLRNPGFTTLLGLSQTLFLLSLNGRANRLLSMPAFVMIAALMIGSLFFAIGLSHGMMRRVPVILGFFHGLGHIALGYAGWYIWRELPFDGYDWPLPGVLAFVIYGPIWGVVASQVVALYLFVAGNFRVNLNELFAGQGIEDYKGFLRLHFGRDGSLTIYPIGLDRVGRKWVPQPNRAAHTPWLDPKKPLTPRLIEEPIKIPA